MKYRTAALALMLTAMPAAAAEPPQARDAGREIAGLDWRTGAQPLTERATIALPPHVRYLDSAGTDRLLTLTGNLPEPGSYTVAADDLHWFAVIDFADIGYVKDDETIDGDALLKSLRESQERANADREAKGLGALTITGWSVAPHYDRASHNLEFGTALHADDGDNVNYTTRILGRHGTMNATLVTSPQTLQSDLGEFRRALGGFAFKPEESYAAYKEGDKVSEYGLAALVAGGAAAALAKGGLLKVILAGLAAFWKLIAVGVVAVLAGARRFFGRVTGGGAELGPPPQD